MAKKDDYYFSHDMNARNDPKILALRMEHGAEGYGVYFMLVEVLRAQKDHCILLEDLPQVLFDLRCDETLLNSVINAFGLFENDGSKFHSVRLCESMATYKFLTQKRIEAGRKGGLSKAKANREGRYSIATANECDSHSIKVKESKGKESKIKEIDEGFECFCNAFFNTYPKRNGKHLEKGETRKKLEVIPKDNRALVIKAAKHYKSSELIMKGIGIKDPKRFFTNDFWKEWVEAEGGEEEVKPSCKILY